MGRRLKGEKGRDWFKKKEAMGGEWGNTFGPKG